MKNSILLSDSMFCGEPPFVGYVRCQLSNGKYLLTKPEKIINSLNKINHKYNYRNLIACY